MKARIITIASSRGVRKPTALLDKAPLSKDAQIEAQPDQIAIRSARPSRADWESASSLMAQRTDDELLDEARDTSFDEAEWEW
jgi:antitoxin component of MazEF toxin-antitoxin module